MSSLDTALKILSLRDHSEHQIREKLARKDILGEELEDVISSLYSYGYLNEERFIDIYIGSKVRGTLYGRNWIRQKLIYDAKSPKHLVDKMLEKSLSDSGYNHVERIESILYKIDRDNDRDNDRKAMASCWGKISRKGYTTSEISSVIST